MEPQSNLVGNAKELSGQRAITNPLCGPYTKDLDARSADQGMLLFGITRAHVSTLFTNKSPITAELRYLTAKMAALLPFGNAADFLGELLPLSAVTTANTIRNRTMNVDKRIGQSAEVLATVAASKAGT
jgi:hypothetical protein